MPPKSPWLSTFGACSTGASRSATACMRSAGERSSDLLRSLGAEQQEHASIALTTCRRRSLECRGLTRVPCRRGDRRRRSRDPLGSVALSTQREQSNKNIGDDETEVPSACQAAFSLARTHCRGVRIYAGMKTGSQQDSPLPW